MTISNNLKSINRLKSASIIERRSVDKDSKMVKSKRSEGGASHTDKSINPKDKKVKKEAEKTKKKKNKE